MGIGGYFVFLKFSYRVVGFLYGVGFREENIYIYSVKYGLFRRIVGFIVKRRYEFIYD